MASEQTWRRHWVTESVSVEHVAKPLNRKNGPHLADLRDFVDACHGLSDDLKVHIEQGDLSESGRRDVTFRVRHDVTRSFVGEEGAPDGNN